MPWWSFVTHYREGGTSVSIRLGATHTHFIRECDENQGPTHIRTSEVSARTDNPPQKTGTRLRGRHSAPTRRQGKEADGGGGGTECGRREGLSRC